jgi:flavin prenyltransferase
MRKIIVAVTGASGAIYAEKLLEGLREQSGITNSAQQNDTNAAQQNDANAAQQSKQSGIANSAQQPGANSAQQNDANSAQQNDADSAQQNTVAVIFSDKAAEIWEYELGSKFIADENITLYDNNDFYAPFASGSSDWDTMIICPASMGMVGRIAGGISNDLISRAADVMLKERRKLIIVPRETPYSLIHINNMKLLTEAGAIICPATPSFYSKPSTIDDLVMTVVERILDLAGIEGNRKRWGK